MRHRGAHHRMPPTATPAIEATVALEDEETAMRRFIPGASNNGGTPWKDHSHPNGQDSCNCYVLWNVCACLMCLPVLLFIFILAVSSTDGDSYPRETTTSSRIAEWSTNGTFVITGADSAVASGVVEHLLRANTARRLVLLCSNRQRCQDTVDQAQQNIRTDEDEKTPTYTPKVHISIVPMDLTSLESIRNCADEIQQQPLSNNNITLVWNAHAHDTLHGPIKTNSLGHLYLTHLLYPHLKRVVVAVSILGGPRWDIAENEWNWTALEEPHSSPHGITFKQALLLLAHHLWKHQSPLEVVVTQAGFTCATTDTCAALGMTPLLGSKSCLRAMLDPTLGTKGECVGHRWTLWGRTVLAGNLDDRPCHYDLDPPQEDALWKWSLQQLDIVAFGTS